MVKKIFVKYVNISIPGQMRAGYADVMLFVYDEEESNVEQTNNNDSDSESNYTNPSNQGSINGLGDETINQ